MNGNKDIKRYLDSIVRAFFGKEELTDEIEKDRKKLIDFIYLIIKDICHNENTNEIEFIDNGFFSIVFGIGNKVLKIGEQRGTKNFPNNPYIIVPLLRRNIKIGYFDFFIEITERVNNKAEISSKELYEFYKEFRDDTKLKFVDIKKENVGILLKDNKVYWNESLYNDDEILGLEPYQG